MYKRFFKKAVACVAAMAFTVSGLGAFGVKAAADTGTSSGSFNVLSLNVAGLPAILSSSNPSENTIQMSSKLNNYDIVSTQEDFAYHSDLISELTLPYQTDFSGNVPFGDGMDIFSKFPICQEKRVKWNDSYGIITNGSDQLTPKGILFTSVEIEPGFYVDVYDIHTDADCDEDSYAARQSNMRQLAAMIQEFSEGHAVIVIGDTNSRYTRAEDNFEEAVLVPCGLTDAWIELIRHGSVPADGDALIDHDHPNSAANEVVDKIWYRSGKNVSLQATHYALLETEFTDSNGEQLSDHYPITATFSYTVNPSIMTSDTFGGGGGTSFTFLSAIDGALPASIEIATGSRVDSVKFVYPDAEASVGGSGGTVQTLVLAEGEYIKSMTVCKAKKSLFGTYRISYVSFTTNFGNTLSGGTYSDNNCTFTAPDGYAIGGLQGFAGDEIDRLGCIYMLLD